MGKKVASLDFRFVFEIGFGKLHLPPGSYTIRLQVMDTSGNARAEKAQVRLTMCDGSATQFAPTAGQLRRVQKTPRRARGHEHTCAGQHR